MTDRERLIEVMARATVSWRWGRAHPGTRDVWINHDSEMMRDAVDAAERAGFRWVAPDDGR